MTKYLERGADKSTYYIQTNNPLEQELAKTKADRRLESCGPTAATMLVAACGFDTAIKCPGPYEPQPEEILTDFFHDPANYAGLKMIRNISPDVLMGNEIPQWYQSAVPMVFNVNCRFRSGLSFEDIIDAIDGNIGVMICLENPGHYLAVVGYDQDTKEIVYNDPWPANRWTSSMAGKSGFNRRVFWAELEKNVKKWRVEIGGKV